MNKESKKTYPWTARRVIALIGIILLIALYASTLIFALMKSPAAKGLLMAAVFCTIVVPVLLYAMTIVAKRLQGSGVEIEEEDSEDPS
ncbi:MAG: hypothetical protein IKE31_03590 [Eubacterium sp.]|nr:hypothetical protein [Eubacterium sp.]